MTAVDELVAFVRAALDARERQLDEDERVALAATVGPWWHDPGKLWLDPEAFEAYDRSKGHEFVGYGDSPFSGCIAATGPASHAQAMNDAVHIAHWDPPRVLDEVKFARAEVDAKRGLLTDYDTAVRQQAENSAKFVAMTDGRPSNEPDYVAVKTHGWTIAGRRGALRAAITRAAQPLAGQPGWRDEWTIESEQT